MAFEGRLGTPDSQLGNIVLGATGEAPPIGGAFTADAVFLKAAAATFTADALLVVTTPGTFTADAVLADIATSFGEFTGRLGTEDSRLGGFVLGLAEGSPATEATFTADATLFKTTATTFTADAVFLNTVSAIFTSDATLAAVAGGGTFTADALLVATTSGSFTANALLIVEVFGDDFNRTETLTFGQPSGPGYYTPITGFGGNVPGVDGAELVVPFDFNFAFSQFSPAPNNFFGTFDFYVGANTDDFQYYEVFGHRVKDTGNLFFVSEVRVFEDGVGLWTADFGQTSNNLPNSGGYDFTPDTDEWYTLKWYIDQPSLKYKLKVWKRSDPEPQTWTLEQDGASITHSANPVFRNDGKIELGSGEFNDAKLDNFHIYRFGDTATTKASITANAYLIRVVSATFTANATLFATQTATFTADALLAAFDTGNIVFYADAVLLAPQSATFTADAHLVQTPVTTFTANAFIVKTFAFTFTANARIIKRFAATFTANAWLKETVAHTFTANAYIFRAVVAPSGEQGLHKTQTLHVAIRRPTALSAFVPPKNPEEVDIEPPSGEPGCLPPCPGVGPGFGNTGVIVRKSIIYCPACGGNYYYTEDDYLGTGTNSGTHPCCNASSHSLADHIHRIWIEYADIPDAPFQMRVKLQWQGSSDYHTVRVHANVQVPDIGPGECLPYDPDYHLSQWGGGDHLGNLSFVMTGGGAVTGGPTYKWSDDPASLTIDPRSLHTKVFRFELGDELNYSHAEFKAANVEIEVGT